MNGAGLENEMPRHVTWLVRGMLRSASGLAPASADYVWQCISLNLLQYASSVSECRLMTVQLTNDL